MLRFLITVCALGLVLAQLEVCTNNNQVCNNDCMCPSNAVCDADSGKCICPSDRVGTPFGDNCEKFACALDNDDGTNKYRCWGFERGQFFDCANKQFCTCVSPLGGDTVVPQSRDAFNCCPEGSEYNSITGNCSCTINGQFFGRFNATDPTVVCKCPPRATLMNSRCVCPGSLVAIDGECACPKGADRSGDNCNCTDPKAELKNDICSCPDPATQEVGDNGLCKCINPRFSIDSTTDTCECSSAFTGYKCSFRTCSKADTTSCDAETGTGYVCEGRANNLDVCACPQGAHAEQHCGCCDDGQICAAPTGTFTCLDIVRSGLKATFNTSHPVVTSALLDDFCLIIKNLDPACAGLEYICSETEFPYVIEINVRPRSSPNCTPRQALDVLGQKIAAGDASVAELRAAKFSSQTVPDGANTLSTMTSIVLALIVMLYML